MSNAMPQTYVANTYYSPTLLLVYIIAVEPSTNINYS